MIENGIMRSESLRGIVSARIPKDVENAIKEKAESEDRPVAYIVRNTLINHFGQKMHENK
ncbi:hypothetical protein [Draconibacterium halophilum]|uniref:Ribbon-helix-helix protein CopG domain-containing protein n=1 Tax=Draconibacterium halophilum TaxID=2706887 RepID=A0A6C0R7X7_9BACT|nr:hypothetical protein [Draconibacterium halophilum]QIA06434.1 hypothetical protein G0Q07_01230 [Draconibacterium halophilum]